MIIVINFVLTVRDDIHISFSSSSLTSSTTERTSQRMRERVTL